MVGCSPLTEQKGDVFLKFALIAFDGEMVMRVSTDQIVGEPALRQQGIGADRLAGDIDGVEYAGKHPDFIRLLRLILTFYGERTDFFWV